MDTHLGDIGWDTFVALGTLALAWTTWRVSSRTGELAKDTKQLAVTTAADVEAQFRPVVVPTSWRISVGGARGERVPISYWVVGEDGDPRRFAITNVGKGPALKVRARGRVTSGEAQEATVSDRAVAVGGAPVHIEMPGPIQIVEGVGRIVDVEYESANGEGWVSAILIEEGNRGGPPIDRWRVSLGELRKRDPAGGSRS